MSKVNVDNPYVTQIDKFANSLRHLSNTFLHLEEKRDTLTQTEMEEIFTEVDESVCKDCENREWCMGENSISTYQMVYEILSAVEEYGVELNTELKENCRKGVYKRRDFCVKHSTRFRVRKKRLFGTINLHRTDRGVPFNWILLPI